MSEDSSSKCPHCGHVGDGSGHSCLGASQPRMNQWCPHWEYVGDHGAFPWRSESATYAHTEPKFCGECGVPRP